MVDLRQVAIAGNDEIFFVNVDQVLRITRGKKPGTSQIWFSDEFTIAVQGDPAAVAEHFIHGGIDAPAPRGGEIDVPSRTRPFSQENPFSEED